MESLKSIGVDWHSVALAHESKALAQAAEIARLKAAMQAVVEGTAPRPLGDAWRTDGVPSKHDTCVHGAPMYNGCEACTDEFLTATLESLP